MKLVTIQLIMVWLVLLASPHLVCGGSFRGSSLTSDDIDITPSGSSIQNHDKHKYRHAQDMKGRDLTALTEAPEGLPPPTKDFVLQEDLIIAGAVGVVNADISPIAAPVSAPEPIRNLARCNGGKAEAWFGYHTLAQIDHFKAIDHSKIWIISSDASEHSMFPGLWKNPLDSTWVPAGYKGDKSCAKFFTIGAGVTDPDSFYPNLVGELNRKADWFFKLSGATKITDKGIDLAKLKSTVDAANTKMNENFDSTALEYQEFPDMLLRTLGTFDSPAYGFNSNGYISGLLNLLGYTVKKLPLFATLHGWDKPVPKEFFQMKYTDDELVRNVVFNSHTCKGGKTELWVGQHSVMNTRNDHSKLFVISSDPTVHKKLGIFQDLLVDRIPIGYKGDWACAKFFSIGAGPSGFLGLGEKLVGALNRENDVQDEFLGAVLVADNVDAAAIKARVDVANINMNKNFEDTTLEYQLFPPDWNEDLEGWDEFNSNSYTAGIQIYLGYNVRKPVYGNLPGFHKPVPTAFFENQYTTDDQVKNEIKKLYSSSWQSFWDSPTVSSQSESVSAEPVQEPTPDP